jgi:hypothetical protein
MSVPPPILQDKLKNFLHLAVPVFTQVLVLCSLWSTQSRVKTTQLFAVFVKHTSKKFPGQFAVYVLLLQV